MKIAFIEITKDELLSAGRFVTEVVRRLVVPKNKRGRIGIIIALCTEENKEKKMLKAELIAQLNSKLQHSAVSDVFSVVQFGERLSSKIQSPEDAAKYLKRARGHFMLYGNLIQRQDNGAQSYVFRLHGLVLHRAIPVEVSKQLAQDFRGVLPIQVAFPEAHELMGFDITRQWISDAVQYVVGLAAGMSGDIQLADRLFSALEQELLTRNDKSGHPIREFLDQRLKARILETLQAKLNLNYSVYVHTRERKYMVDCHVVVQSILARNPDDYHARLFGAIALFYLGRIDEAIELLEQIHNADSTWRYNLGFLYAFDGQNDKALEQYRRAFYGTTTSNVLNDTEIFCTEAIGEHPKLIQLVFFRGLLNHKGKADYLLAKQDFQLFLDHAESTTLPKLKELAIKYLGECNVTLGV